VSRTARLAWIVLGINVITVLGGTVVRATGSGAGCGRSWPTCQGNVMPGFGSVSTIIEYSHRALSGLALLGVLALFILVFRRYAAGSQARRAVALSALAIVIESLLGAWLVLAELVADDASVLRAVSVPVHLVNTLFLLGCITITAWLVTTERKLAWSGPARRQLLLGAVGIAIVGASGAVTALADTLFPAESLAEGLAADFDARAHFLTRLRVLHPIVAIVAGAWLLRTAGGDIDRHKRAAIAVIGLLVAQYALGILNVVLLTPLAAQIAHLLVADLLWVAWIVLGSEKLAEHSNVA
jgi:heme A synthase